MRKVLFAILLTACSQSQSQPQPAAPAPQTQTKAQAPQAKAPSITRPSGVSIQMPIGGNGEEPPHLDFKIVKSYANQKPIDHAPWHTSGGEWTFFDAEAHGAHFTVGHFAKPMKNPELAGFGGFGDGMIAVPTSDDGAQLASAFGAIFLVPVPQSGPKGKTNALQFRTAVLGDHVARSPAGGFGDTGSWIATKWFLNGGEAEIFFNFDLESGRGEFSQKDSDYDKGVAAQLAHGLRDGVPGPDKIK